MIIGIAGTNGAGKDEAARYLVAKGFVHLSLSDALREYARSRDKEPTREVLQKLGNELRAKRGGAFLAKQVLQKVAGAPHIVLSSIRNLGELEPVKNTDGFRLLFMDASAEIRFERAQLRGRAGEGLTLEQFLQLEEKELNAGAGRQNLDQLRQAATQTIINEGTIEELHRKLDEVVGEITQRPRLSWDEYFMQIARQVASRSTCDRKRCGAVLVRDRVILSTGYNGSISGTPHCDEVGHMMENGHCVRTIHAEMNAIAQAAKNGINIDGATLYVTASPCWECFKVLANAGIKRVCYGEFYRDQYVLEAARQSGVEMVNLSDALQQSRPE